MEALAQQLRSQSEEARLAKGEARSKEETFDRFEKQISNSSKEVSDLRS